MNELTPAEAKIEYMRRNGVKQREIAELLGISIRTVQIHCRRIAQKRGTSRGRVTPRYLYFIAAPALRLIKVGVAVDVRQRMRLLHSHCPVDLYLIKSVATADALGVEARILRQHKPVRGEWLRDTPSLRREIRRLR